MPSVSSVMAHTNLSITVNSHGTARQTRRPTPQGWRLRRVSYALIPSNVQIVEANIKQT